MSSTSVQNENHGSVININDVINEDPINKQEIICFFHRFKKIAAASFNPFTHELKIVETSNNTSPYYVVVKTILRNDCYRQVLVNANIPNDLFEVMKAFEQDLQCSLLKIPSHLFNYNELQKVIADTTFLNHTGMNNLFFTSAFDTADERLVCATGGLFHFIKSELKTGSEGIKINNITNILSNNNLWMDGETYKCLNIFDIFQNRSHFRSTTQDDIESFSLYSIIEKHCSFLGSTKLRHFMVNPTTDKDILKSRHEVIRFYLEPNNAAIVKYMKAYINHLSPVSMLMTNVKCTAVRGKHWKKIYQNIYYSVSFAEMCAENDVGVQMFSQIKNCITEEMYAMAYHLDRIVDLEKMETNDVFVIKSGVCDSLENAKMRFHNLMKQLNNVTPFEFDCVPEYVKEVHMIHIPETKFFLGIPYWKQNLTKPELVLPDLDYSFSANETAYYKSKRCYNLDELIGDPQTRLINEEANIIRALGSYIKKNIHFTAKLIEMIGDLDCIFAMAALAKEYNYTEPLLLNHKILDIKHGTHPLLNKFNNTVMANSITSSSDDGGLVNVVFGLNSSGKTVYLKQVALHTYMCHIGSFIPASLARIGVINHIYTRMSPNESIVTNSSSFMNELRRLVTIISHSSPNSLLILDEVGRGTTELEGTAILAGCLKYFVKLKENSPHIIISTHLDSIKNYLDDNLFFNTHQMDYVLDGVDYSVTYTLKSGKETRHTDDSSLYPLDVPDNIATAAKEVLKALRKGKSVIPNTNLRKLHCQRICNYLKRFIKMNPMSNRTKYALENEIFM